MNCSKHVETECPPDDFCQGRWKQLTDLAIEHLSNDPFEERRPLVDIVSPSHPCSICGEKLLDGTEAIPFERIHARHVAKYGGKQN